MRIVLDTTILVRATDKSHGPARELLLKIIASRHILLLSNEMLYELAKVLRYPRMIALYGLSEARVYDFIAYLRKVADIVTLSPLLTTPSRDVNDVVVLQTAVIGEANILCTRDDDFFSPPAAGFLERAGIEVMDEIALLHRLRS